MESKSFVKLLRKIVREEVQSVVRKELKTALNEQKVNHNKVINHGLDLHKIAEQDVRGPIARTQKRKYAKDSMLNDILNETSAHQSNDWPEMNFRSEMASSFGMDRAMPSSLATTGINGEPVNMNNEQVAQTVQNMTKDYSALMKAIEKKKGR